MERLRDMLAAKAEESAALVHRVSSLEASSIPQQIKHLDAILSGLEGRLTVSEASIREDIAMSKATASVELDSTKAVIAEVQTVLRSLPWRELQSDVTAHTASIAAITARMDSAFDELKVSRTKTLMWGSVGVLRVCVCSAVLIRASKE
jgi:chromosome segregation ATPase